MRRPLLKKLSPLALLFSLSLSLWTASLGAAEKSPSEVELKIGTIFATNSSDEFDPKLSKVKKQLEVLKYRSYRLLKEETKKVPWRESVVFEIPGGRSLVITPQEFRNDRLALKVRLLEGGKPHIDTTVRLRNRGNFLLGGVSHEGGKLIFSISGATQ